MQQTRRFFLKTVVLGAAGAAGCHFRPVPAPFDPRRQVLDGESFTTCHMVRDGGTFPRVEPTGAHDVIVVGGGPSGLAAAWYLRKLDVLLLEKEDRLGGACIADEWEGVRMSTGGAFYTQSEESLVEFFDEIGVKGVPVEGTDALVIQGTPYTDFFEDGADRLPFPPQVREDFKRSKSELLRLYMETPEGELASKSFASILSPYAPELRKFWDRFGMSNWGGDAQNTSAYVGAEAYTWATGGDDQRYTFPGGLGGAAGALANKLKAHLGGRIVTEAAVYLIERRDPDVIVHYLKNGEPNAVRARAVVVALPKYFAARIIPDLPRDQMEAMKRLRYEPFPVFNVCLNSAGPEPSYDNWFYDTPFTDFIPADWVIHAGKGPANRKTVLTVYHPLFEYRRAQLLEDSLVLDMVDNVAAGLESHFPGTLDKITQVRVFRRGHPMPIAFPGSQAIAERAAKPHGAVFFANTDGSYLPTFSDAVGCAWDAAEAVKQLLTGERVTPETSQTRASN